MYYIENTLTSPFTFTRDNAVKYDSFPVMLYLLSIYAMEFFTV